MTNRRAFIHDIGAAFLCLGLGLKLGAPPVVRPVPGVKPDEYVLLDLGSLVKNGAGDLFTIDSGFAGRATYTVSTPFHGRVEGLAIKEGTLVRAVIGPENKLQIQVCGESPVVVRKCRVTIS